MKVSHGHGDPRDALLHSIEESATPAHHVGEIFEESEKELLAAKAKNEGKPAPKSGGGHGDGQPHGGGEHLHVSYMPMEVERTLPPNLRQFTRWEYLAEYVEWWRQGITSKIQTILFFALGLLTLETFPPGALLMFMLAGRHKELAWMYDFIAKKFGYSRTLTLVD